MTEHAKFQIWTVGHTKKKNRMKFSINQSHHNEARNYDGYVGVCVIFRNKKWYFESFIMRTNGKDFEVLRILVHHRVMQTSYDT